MKSESKIAHFFSFLGEVRKEIKKISWPGKKEVIVTTVVVFIMAIMAAIFFRLVDFASFKVVGWLIGK